MKNLFERFLEEFITEEKLPDDEMEESEPSYEMEGVDGNPNDDNSELPEDGNSDMEPDDEVVEDESNYDPYGGQEDQEATNVDLGKLYILKEIYGKLLILSEILSKYSDPSIIDINNRIRDSIEVFHIITDNIEKLNEEELLDNTVKKYIRFTKDICLEIKTEFKLLKK